LLAELVIRVAFVPFELDEVVCNLPQIATNLLVVLPECRGRVDFISRKIFVENVLQEFEFNVFLELRLHARLQD